MAIGSSTGTVPPRSTLSSGFSLLECLLAVVILATLTRLALPGFEQVTTHREGSLVLQQVANSIYLGRTVAARHGAMAVLCPSGDGLACGGDWQDGLLLFLDANDNQRRDEDEAVEEYLPFEGVQGTLHWRAFRSKPYLQITPLGFTRYQNGSFTWCDLRRSAASAHQLILNRTGRVRFARDRDRDGIRENSRGEPIRCPG